MFFGVKLGFDIIGKLAERFGLRINRSFEGADSDLIGIPGVDQHDIGIGNQRVPILGLNIGANQTCGINRRHTKRHDFFLEAYFQSQKRHCLGIRQFVFQIGKPGQRTDLG